MAGLVQALAATLTVHGQTVTARRMRADAEKALAALQPRPVAQRLVEVTFPDLQGTPPGRAEDGAASSPAPRTGLSEAEVAQALLAATFEPLSSVPSPPTAATPDEALPRRPRRHPGPRQEPPRQR